MARSARLILPNEPHYVYLKGNNAVQVFHDDEDKENYYRFLHEASKIYHVNIHAYVLLDFHVHILATPTEESSLAKMMQWVGRHYVPFFNKRHNGSGTLWEGRFRSCVVEKSHWLMACMRYIEILPVQAELVEFSKQYKWSSYCHHMGYRHDSLITDCSEYWSLGNTPFEREINYKTLFEEHLSKKDIDFIAQCSQKGWPIGSLTFINELSQKMGRVFRMGHKGRPRKINR